MLLRGVELVDNSIAFRNKCLIVSYCIAFCYVGRYVKHVAIHTIIFDTGVCEISNKPIDNGVR